ncbi:energy transducer TonB [Pseudomonas sp. SWRI81]|uniref:energy transducer TonB n=1 Tax=Pseudomonas sp. SWRI81 TaxID=2745505 RepID=UPI001645BC80|nr:energy transducer TonB [Pseudomonas sp. SWRI81]MBC3272897.1 energy transducer TonB [Pseudomonas sp. SWRI81]
MRWFFVGLLLIVGGSALASDVFLIPENNPKPIYPRELQRAGVTGDVKVGFIARADGSVSEISIRESSHPDFAEAVRVAIAQWRFKPWTVEGDKPEEQEIIAPMIFRLENQPLHINQWLKTVKCRAVNENLGNMSEFDWVDSNIFAYTRAYLSNSLTRHQLSDEKRLAMIAKMNKRVSMIVRSCRENPMRKFTSLLPVEIRELL